MVIGMMRLHERSLALAYASKSAVLIGYLGTNIAVCNLETYLTFTLQLFESVCDTTALRDNISS